MGKRSTKRKSKQVSAPKIMTSQQTAPKAPIKEKPIEPTASRESAARSVASRLAAAQKKRFTEDFANAIAVIMRARKLKDIRVSDLEWLLLPPLLAGQCRVSYSQRAEGGSIFPSALVLWARVSDAVDKGLSENLTGPPKLTSADWTSGDKFWLIMTAGETQGISAVVKNLQETVFKDRPVKMRSQKPDGTLIVRSLSGDQPRQAGDIRLNVP